MDAKRFKTRKGDCYITDLEVCRSAAGYYIGRMCWDIEMQFEEPYARESGYYPTREAAQKELKNYTFEVRDCEENNASYADGTLPQPKAN